MHKRLLHFWKMGRRFTDNPPFKLRLAAVIALLPATILVWLYGYYFLRTQHPLQGNIQVQGLPATAKGLSIYWDNRQIPAIQANNLREGMFALGFVHARERIWQMELLRLSARGNLSLLFGKTMLSYDQFLQTIGFGHRSLRIYNELPAQQQQLLLQYSAGINAYLKKYSHSLSPEFALLSYRPREWRPADSVAIYKFLQWQWSNDLKDRIILQKLVNSKEKKPAKHILRDLLIGALGYSSQSEPLPTIFPQGNFLLLQQNNKKEMAILSTLDQIRQEPGQYFLAGISLPNTQFQGITVPGVPLFFHGRSPQIAWFGLPWRSRTSDSQSPFSPLRLVPVQENSSTESYRLTAQEPWQKIRKRNVQLLCRSSDGLSASSPLLSFTVKESSHGVFIQAAYNGLGERIRLEHPYLLDWRPLATGSDFSFYLDLLEQTKRIDADQMQRSFSQAPMLLLIRTELGEYITTLKGKQKFFSQKDEEKNSTIGQVVGELKAVSLHHLSVDRTAKQKKKLFALSPDWWPEQFRILSRYAASANVDNTAFALLQDDYAPLDQQFSRTIAALIQKSSLSLESLEKPKQDALTQYALRESPSFASQLKLLENWDGRYQSDSAGALLFQRIRIALLRNVLYDEIGESLTDELFSLPFYGFHLFQKIFLFGLENPDHPLFDIKRSKRKKENFYDILRLSFYDAIFTLQKHVSVHIKDWSLGKMHRVSLRHPLANDPVWRLFTGKENLELSGGWHPFLTALALPFDREEVRLVAGLKLLFRDGKAPLLVSTYSSQSGHPNSFQYRTLHRLWSKNQFFEWPFFQKNQQHLYPNHLRLQGE